MAKLEPTIDEDVVLIFPSGNTRYGKDAFMAFHKSWFASSTTWTQDNTVIHTDVEGCKTAWASVDYVYKEYDAAGNVTSTSHALFALTWTRDKGKWVVIADQNTRLPL
ncbi:MAG: nuclear transport factor 2 family protein [Micrococcales bacterium]|nr:nuclear transport factor 2 family protein [Micrococcales bacterium]